MNYEFEVLLHKWHHNRGDFIFARRLDDTHIVDVPEGSIFGDVPEYLYSMKYKGDNGDGTPEYNMYVFQPISLQFLPRDYFIRGQRVVLITNDVKIS